MNIMNMNNMNANNNVKGNRYKTTMCKHFEQNGHCPLGQKCHFAHGKAELRSVNDPLPPGVSGINPAPKPVQAFSGPSNPSGNFRTAKCKFFDKGLCRFGDKCSFAHGDVEPKQMMNNDSNSNGFHNNMSGSTDKNLENEVAYQQIQFLASQMEDCHANDKELLNQIKQATELNKSGNVQDAASILYGIMSRPNKSKQDIDSYAMFVYKIQQYGNSLYQQLQSKQYNQENHSMGYNQSGNSYGGTPSYNDGHGYSGSYGMNNNNYGASNAVGYTYDSYSGGYGNH